MTLARWGSDRAARVLESRSHDLALQGLWISARWSGCDGSRVLGSRGLWDGMRKSGTLCGVRTRVLRPGLGLSPDMESEGSHGSGLVKRLASSQRPETFTCRLHPGGLT